MSITLNGTTGITSPDINVTAQTTGFTTTGNLTAADLTLSGGVYIGGTGAANLLDDYEEGTWDIKLTGVDTGQTGSYTKVGNVVTIHADFTATATANGTTIGLPFTAIAVHGALVVGYLSATAAKSVYVNGNTASGISTVAGGTGGSALTNGERMILAGSYIANA